eukprot:CAMPEP_0197920898 /NCGR_PEP_ID=MMETSP1439-20131203/89770_1 /TAXON_ID=66791 /ORGANISM="Gonyaulax spinifera, Strain CCMP409" /LENGTH=37 /DNA_ID= /DNA_START= /DNA_END= /DNA_ORIENTATION=
MTATSDSKSLGAALRLAATRWCDIPPAKVQAAQKAKT